MGHVRGYSMYREYAVPCIATSTPPPLHVLPLVDAHVVCCHLMMCCADVT